MSGPSCVFCEIVAGREAASFVYRDESVVALMDVAPINEGHTLVVPRQHVESLAGLDEETGAEMFRVAMRMAGAIRRSGLPCEGINLWLADGEAAFQDVFHVHLHVVPRVTGDSFRIAAEFAHPSRGALDVTAERIRAASRARTG